MKKIVLLAVVAIIWSMTGKAQEGFRIIGDLDGSLGGKLQVIRDDKLT